MAGPVKPISPVSKPRSIRRRLQLFLLRERLEEHAAEPEPAPASACGPVKQDTPAAPAGVTAQLLGERERRGLRAGYEVREQARAIYLENEFAGPRDRRARKGRITKTDI